MINLQGVPTLDDLDVAGRRVFVRVDFNVPLDKATGQVASDARIVAALPTLRQVVERGGRLVLASHLGRPKGKPEPRFSLEPVGARLAELTGWEVHLPDDCIGDAAKKVVAGLREGQVALLENLRFHAEEEANDEAFARELSTLADVYVNDAFGCSHRAHASVEALPRLMREHAMGLLVQAELTALTRVVEAPERPFVAVLGGAKVADKIAVIEALLARCDAICIGGAMANTLLAATGLSLGASRVEADWLARSRVLLDQARSRGVDILLPTDVVVGHGVDATAGTLVPVAGIPGDAMALDVGPATVRAFAERIAGARTVFWNGPLGVFENPAFAAGTLGVARAVADAPGFTVVGGGDSAAAVEAAGPEVLARVDFISTGGGASLELVEGKRLPGVEALRTRGPR